MDLKLEGEQFVYGKKMTFRAEKHLLSLYLLSVAIKEHFFLNSLPRNQVDLLQFLSLRESALALPMTLCSPGV